MFNIGIIGCGLIGKKRALSLEIENLKIQVFMTGLEESDFMTFNKKSYIINLNHK